MVLLLIVAPIVCGDFVLRLCSVVNCLVSFRFCIRLGGKETAGCFALVVFLVSCGCWCSVALPRGAVTWSVVCSVS